MPTAELDARSRRWQTTNDPAVLWPDLDVGLLPAAALAIESSVSRALDSRWTTLGAADGVDANAIGVAALISGTGPLLGYWLEQGMLDVAEPLARVLRRHIAHGRARAARIRGEIMPALTAVACAGVTAAILKGFHTSHVYFPEAGTRPLADVDVYVEPHLVTRTESALASTRFHRGESGPFKANWYPTDEPVAIRSFEFWHALSPWRIELHSAIEFGTLMRHGVHLDSAMPVDQEWAGMGLPLRVMPQPLLFVALAAHASCELESSRLIRLIELTWMIRRDVALHALDWWAATDLMERTGATRFVYPALSLVERLAPDTVPPELLARSARRSTRIARAVVRDLTPATPILHEHVSLAGRLMWEPTMWGVMRRFAEMFLPERGMSLAQVVFVYRARILKLFGGRVSWRLARAPRSVIAR